MSLSPRDQKILAALEDELGKNDPALVAAFAKAPSPSPALQRFPSPAAHICLLVLALFTLVIVGSLVLKVGAAGLVILTAALIVPWIVTAFAAEQRYRNGPSTAPGGSADQDVLT